MGSAGQWQDFHSIGIRHVLPEVLPEYRHVRAGQCAVRVQQPKRGQPTYAGRFSERQHWCSLSRISHIGIAQNNDIPYTLQYNLTVERELTSNTKLEVAYVANRAKHLEETIDANYVVPGTAWRMRIARRPIPIARSLQTLTRATVYTAKRQGGDRFHLRCLKDTLTMMHCKLCSELV